MIKRYRQLKMVLKIQHCHCYPCTIWIVIFLANVLVVTTCPLISSKNLNIGVLFNILNKNSNDFSAQTYNVTEVQKMLQLVSTKFRRISTNGINNHSASARSLIPQAAANLNRDGNDQLIEAYLSLADEDAARAVNVENIMNLVTITLTANSIFPGTVKGLEISTSYEDLSTTIDEIKSIHASLTGESNLNKLPFEIGILSSDCEEYLQETLQVTKNPSDLQSLDFLMCIQMPGATESPEQSAEKVAQALVRARNTLRQANFGVIKVIGRTGWPSAGRSAEGVTGSRENMKRYWCHLYQLSKEYDIMIDIFSAFDDSIQITKVSTTTAEYHYGWWERRHDESSDSSAFLEKVKPSTDWESEAARTLRVRITTGIFGGLSIIVLIVVVVILYFKLRTIKRQLLSEKDIYEFMMGCKDSSDCPEDVLKLPYDTRFEIPKSRFTIDMDSILGKGAFGTVFKGTVGGIDNFVAFKMANSDSSVTSLKSLLSEIKIMIHVMEHPNVLRILGACTSDLRQGTIIIAMEFCEVGSLHAYLLQKKPAFCHGLDLSVPEPLPIRASTVDLSILTYRLRKWAYEIACGMEHIASRKIIHSDLATRNILLTTLGSAKITDFGLSRRLYDYTNYVKQNQEPLPWRWMAIESLEQMEFSVKTDVWAFGVTLFEIFSLGLLPYAGLSWNIDFPQAIRSGLRLSRPQLCSEDEFSTMQSCWNLDPSNRPDFTTLKNIFSQHCETIPDYTVISQI